MSANLARILADTAERRPDGIAYKLDGDQHEQPPIVDSLREPGGQPLLSSCSQESARVLRATTFPALAAVDRRTRRDLSGAAPGAAVGIEDDAVERVASLGGGGSRELINQPTGA